MFRMLGAAVAALVLSTAGSASAAVLFEKSGGATYFEGFLTAAEWNPYLDAEGSIEIAVDWDEPGAVGALWFDSHRKYTDGHEETLQNEIYAFSPGSQGSGYGGSWYFKATTTGFSLRLKDVSDYHCQDWQPGVNCKWDTLKSLLAFRPGDTYPIGYSLTISSAPEPGTWLLLIAGFGLVGGALRRRQAAMFQNRPI